jgi:uncharacterized protein
MASQDNQILSVVKSLILDEQATGYAPTTRRRSELKSLPGKAAICVGVRRCGKSTVMRQIMEKLEKSGVSKENFLVLNLFDDRLSALSGQSIGLITDAFFSLYPDKKNSEKIYIFLDEIQSIQGWERYIDRLLRTENCEVFLTGSSARMLSKEIGTQMRGRSISWELFPFSFLEFLDFKDFKTPKSPNSKQAFQLQKLFQEFWTTGGFPEVFNVSASMRVKIHQEYKQSIILRDLIERHDISHPKAIIDLATWLINNNGCLYSINNLTGYLKSLGHKLAKSSVSQYLDWFEDAYFLFSVRLFDPSLARSNANPKKIYCVDHGLVSSISSQILVNSGRLLESLVFVALRRDHAEIFYYRTKSGKEVDFIVPNKRHGPTLIQVCESLHDPKTRKRELAALDEAMWEQKIKSAVIVTMADSETIDTHSGTIQIVPAWKYLLSLNT